MKKKKKNTIKNRKLNCSLHTKKVTILPLQHSKITKLKKNKNKKVFFCTDQYCPKLASMDGKWPVRLIFKLIQNVGISIPIYVPIRYILASTDMVSTTLIFTSYNKIVNEEFKFH